jgi:hypothetical protein
MHIRVGSLLAIFQQKPEETNMVSIISKNGIGVRPRFVRSTIPVLTALLSICLLSIFAILEIESSRKAALLVSRRVCFDYVMIRELRAW